MDDIFSCGNASNKTSPNIVVIFLVFNFVKRDKQTILKGM